MGAVVVATALPMFLVSLNNLVVTSALPVLARDLAATPQALQWVVHAYSLPFAGLLLAAAPIADRLGRRRVFSAGIACFALGSALCAVSGTLGMFMVGRSVQGLGAAIVFPLSLVLLVSAVGDRERASVIGLWSAVNGLGIALGPLVGGSITESLGWSYTFWFALVLGLVCIPLVRRGLAEERAGGSGFDVPGLATASGAVCAVIWGLAESSQHGWASPSTVLSLTLGVVLVSR